MKMSKMICFFALILIVVNAIPVFGQPGTDRRPPREKWIQVTLEAQVEAIDLKSRELTLRDAAGGLVTVEVDKSVARLGEVEVGDKIITEFWTYLGAEFREPTAEEKATPLVVLAEAGKAPEGMPPSAVVGAVVQAVVTIEIINRPDMEVTVKGPQGKYVAIEMVDQALIQKLNVGEVVILTYAEALALSLEKVNPNTE